MTDRREHTKVKMLKTWIPLLLNAAFGLGFLFIFLMRIRQMAGYWDLTVLGMAFVFLIIGFLLAIHIHEMGHCMIGQMFGYKLISYRVGFLAWNYENGRMRFSILRNRGYGGLCAMLPPEEDLKEWQQILFFGGGLLANYLTVLVVWSVQAVWTGPVIGRLFIFSLGAASLLLALTNTIPLTVGNNLTDGSILLSLLLKKPVAEKMIRLNRFTAQLAAGIRPRDLDLPEAWPTADIYDLTLLVYRYFQSLDRNDLNQTLLLAEKLARSLSKFPSYMLPSLYYELCYTAAVAGDAAKAEKYYQQAGQILQRDEDVNGLRVKAYYAWYIQQDPQKALELARRGLTVAPLFPLPGQGQMEKDLLERLIQIIEKDPHPDFLPEGSCG
jgi:hypothetical protein